MIPAKVYRLTYCQGCLEKQQVIDRLREENVRLKAKLRYQERTAKEGPFGSSTPSAKVPLKANSAPENSQRRGGAKPGHQGHGRHGVSDDEIMGEWGIRWDVPGAGRQFAAVMEARRQGEADEEFKPLRRGWCLGSELFRADMLRYVEDQRGAWHYGAELRESAEAKADRLSGEALRAQGAGPGQLRIWRKDHPFKLRLAAKLRAETTVTVAWIAARLCMRSRGRLSHLFYRYANARPDRSTEDQPTLGI